MTGINGFDFSKYDVGGRSAWANDGFLTGEEAEKAMADRWNVFSGFKKGEVTNKVMSGSSVINKSGDKISVFNDAKGNEVTRVDFHNDDGDFFDKEVVRDKEGNLVSTTQERHDSGKRTRYFVKNIYNKAGDIIKTIETTFKNGKKISVKELMPGSEGLENVPSGVIVLDHGDGTSNVIGKENMQENSTQGNKLDTRKRYENVEGIEY